MTANKSVFVVHLRETFPDSMSRASHVRSAREPVGTRLRMAHTCRHRKRDGGLRGQSLSQSRPQHDYFLVSESCMCLNCLCNRVLAESIQNLLPPGAALPNLEHFVVPSSTASALFHVYTYETLMRYKSARSYCFSQGCGVNAGNIPVCACWLHLAYFTSEQGKKGGENTLNNAHNYKTTVQAPREEVLCLLGYRHISLTFSTTATHLSGEKCSPCKAAGLRVFKV